ncbi:MAG TPA: hypothetical protein VMT46_00215 [Anaerolineaceae bacterium]|nr:hypothetical protein [Anaerolineaceae bacterium]
MGDVYQLTPLHRLPVARLMARIQGDRWDMQEALELLNACQGWFLDSPQQGPVGWLAARRYTTHRTVEIESMGYNDGGRVKIGPELAPLMDACEDWAVREGMVNARFITGSRGMSCHNKEIILPGLEIQQLNSEERPDFDWLVMRGYQPCGVLPEIYGHHYHGILLIKHINPLDIGALFQAMT